MPRWQRILRFAAPVLLAAILITAASTISQEQVTGLIDRLQGEWRTWAVPSLIVGGTCLVALGFPGTIVSMTAGAAFSFAVGFPSALSVAFLAAVSTCAAGRMASDRSGRDPGGAAWLRRVRTAIGDADWRFVALLRVTPVLPYAMVNFMLGSWRVPWPAVLVGTALGIIPGTAAHVYLGAAGRRLLTGGELHPIEWVLIGIGVLSIPITGWMFTRMVKRRSGDEVDPDRRSRVGAPAPCG